MSNLKQDVVLSSKLDIKKIFNTSIKMGECNPFKSLITGSPSLTGAANVRRNIPIMNEIELLQPYIYIKGQPVYKAFSVLFSHFFVDGGGC